MPRKYGEEERKEKEGKEEKMAREASKKIEEYSVASMRLVPSFFSLSLSLLILRLRSISRNTGLVDQQLAQDGAARPDITPMNSLCFREYNSVQTFYWRFSAVHRCCSAPRAD